MGSDRALEEELVSVRSEDGFRLDGAVFRPCAMTRKPLAVVQVPGGSTPFSNPVHVGLGRALAARGYVVVAGNNRGSAFGDLHLRDGKGPPVVSGLAWETMRESPLDIGPWIEFAAGLGCSAVALLGHSLGGGKVVYYQAERADPRVCALLLASPAPLQYGKPPALALADAQRLVAEGRGNDLLPWGALGSATWTLSARALLDWHPTADAPDRDVFGQNGVAAEPAIARVTCPVLAWYGTEGDAGTEANLAQIRAAATSSPRVETRLVEGADHGYRGHEAEVAAMIADWLDVLG